jgi:hypothetical protein
MVNPYEHPSRVNTENNGFRKAGEVIRRNLFTGLMLSD